jgi:hypothetical protein
VDSVSNCTESVVRVWWSSRFGFACCRLRDLGSMLGQTEGGWGRELECEVMWWEVEDFSGELEWNTWAAERDRQVWRQLWIWCVGCRHPCRSRHWTRCWLYCLRSHRSCFLALTSLCRCLVRSSFVISLITKVHLYYCSLVSKNVVSYEEFEI